MRHFVLWVQGNDKEWYTLVQGDDATINDAVKYLSKHYPHTSYKTQQVEPDDYTIFSKNFITKKY
jgi:hypothetical protein